MNEGFPVQSTQKTNFQEGHTMSKKFTTDDFARVIDTIGKEFTTARILPERLTTMVEYTYKNLAKEGAEQNPSKKVLEKAITAALKSHKGLILSNRKKMYRRAVEMLLIEDIDQSIKTQEATQRLRLDMFNTEQQRGGDPSD